jgi:hypothetical protein
MATAGRRFGRSPGWLSIVENGLHPIRMDDLTDLLDFYGVTDEPLRESLLYLAHQARRKKYWTSAHERRLSDTASDLASLEFDSAHIRAFQPNLIPGLLQTQDYASAVFKAGLPLPGRDINALLNFRMARQAVLNQSSPPLFQAVIGEAALHQLIGSSQVMHAQLERLMDASQSEHIDLHVLPYQAGACLGVSASFDLFSLRPPGCLTIAMVTQVARTTFFEADEVVSTHELAFDHLMAASHSKHHSLELIGKLLSRA